MSEIDIRADVARRLMADEGLAAVLKEISDAAVAVFLNASSTDEAVMSAREGVRAVETIRNALQARITEQTIAVKRGQHRAND